MPKSIQVNPFQNPIFLTSPASKSFYSKSLTEKIEIDQTIVMEKTKIDRKLKDLYPEGLSGEFAGKVRFMPYPSGRQTIVDPNTVIDKKFPRSNRSYPQKQRNPVSAQRLFAIFQNFRNIGVSAAEFGGYMKSLKKMKAINGRVGIALCKAFDLSSKGLSVEAAKHLQSLPASGWAVVGKATGLLDGISSIASALKKNDVGAVTRAMYGLVLGYAGPSSLNMVDTLQTLARDCFPQYGKHPVWSIMAAINPNAWQRSGADFVGTLAQQFYNVTVKKGISIPQLDRFIQRNNSDGLKALTRLGELTPDYLKHSVHGSDRKGDWWKAVTPSFLMQFLYGGKK